MFRVEVCTGRQASSSNVSLLVDVEAVLPVNQTQDGSLHMHLPSRELREGDVALHLITGAGDSADGTKLETSLEWFLNLECDCLLFLWNS